MKTTQEVFKETLEELGFANHKPSQMTNSDYWLCTNTAMEKYANERVNNAIELFGHFCRTLNEGGLEVNKLSKADVIKSVCQRCGVSHSGEGYLCNKCFDEIN